MKKLILSLILSFTFIWQINAQLVYDNACTIAFDDISATGTDLMLGDDQEATISIPFTFTLDGVSSSNLRVGNNGGVLFGFTAGQVTSSSEPTVVGFYPFSDDIDSTYGAVLWETLGTAPNRRVVIMWSDRPHFSNSPSGATFELILHETSNDITFLYQDLDFGIPAFNDGLSAGIRVVGANGFYTYSINTALGSVTCINWSIPSCFNPTSLNALPASLTDTTISWTAGDSETNWNYEWGETGFTQGTGNTGVVSATPILNLMSLTTGTTYDIYIQSDCGGGNTSAFELLTWTQPNIGDICTQPIMVTLESDCSMATPYLLDYTVAVDLGSFSCDTVSPNNGAWFQVTAPDSGAINVITTNFMTDMAIFSDCGTQLFCYSLTSFFPLTDLNPGDTYFIALWKDGATTGTSNICFEEITCAFPTDLDTTITSDTDAEISWIANNTETAWEYVVQAQGDGVPVGAGISTTENPTTIVGTNGVAYEFYVRANCGAGDFSAWSGPFRWRQLVPPANDDCSEATPYTDSFTMLTQGNCSGTPNILDLSAATNSVGTENPGCDGFNDFGVYYTWTATSVGITFTSGTGAPGLVVYEAGTCGSLVEVGCINNFSDVIEGLTIGDNYIFHIWDDTVGNIVDFCLEEYTPPPIPVNDDCNGATPYTDSFTMFTEGNCSTPNILDLSGATNDTNDTPTCDGFNNFGVWYTWTATSVGLTFTSGTGLPGFAIYEAGTCGTLVEVGCLNNTSGIIEDLIISNNYILYVWDETAGNIIDFCLEEYTPPPVPVNDDCSGATPYTDSFTMFTEGNCSTPNILDLSGATIDTNDTPTCDGFNNFGVWYTWTATSVGLNFTSGTGNPGLAVYEVGTCGSLVEIGCINNPSGLITGLTINNNYILYFWDNTVGNIVDFCLEEYTPPPIPVNDDCNGATPYTNSFTMFTEGNCVGTPNILDLRSATSDTGNDDASCNTSSLNIGVWYTWTATSNGLTFTSGNVTSVGLPGLPGFAIYEEGTCGSLVEVGCLNNHSGTIEGLTIGNDYIFYIWDDTENNIVNFCLEEFTTPLPPVNDFCANAIPLTIGTVFTDNPLSGTNVSATDSGEIPLPLCASYLGGDLWYSVVVPTDGNITIEMDSELGGTPGDAGFSVYSGACGSLTSIICNDDSGNGLFPKVNISDINLAGQNVYIRVWEFGNNNTINFQISAYSDTTLGLENTTIEKFEYFPNPVNNTLTLRTQNSIQKINVYNMLGQEVMKIMPNNVSVNVDMSNLSQGPYFVKITINNTTQTIKVIKM